MASVSNTQRRSISSTKIISLNRKSRVDSRRQNSGSIEQESQEPRAAIIEMADSKDDAREKRRKARLKAKAEKAYEKAVKNSGSLDSSTTSRDGSRPALYKAKMGASQKKSTKMQTKAAKSSAQTIRASAAKITSKHNKHVETITGALNAVSAFTPVAVLLKGATEIMRKFARLAFALLMVAVAVVFLYGPAQQYYVQMRETERLQAEYAAVSQREDAISADISSLQTPEGIEDKAHEDLGYIKKGEETASVRGYEAPIDDSFSASIVPGSIPAPDTWYSPILDIVFGYLH